VAYIDLVSWMSPGGTDFTHAAVCLTAGAKPLPK